MELQTERLIFHFVFILFLNNYTNKSLLLTKLLGDGPVGHSSLVQVSNLDSVVV